MSFKVEFTIHLNTSTCDPEALDDLQEQVRAGVERMLDKTMPSGDFGPYGSLSEAYDLKISQ